LRRRYRDLFLPTMIFAGEGDRIVFRRRADRLHAILPNSDLEVVGHVGHMLHHIVPGRVAAAVRRIAGESRFTRKRECRRAGNGRTGSPSIASQ
jgi:pimeloyl-ACP methyl ester carboxylesterase